MKVKRVKRPILAGLLLGLLVSALPLPGLSEAGQSADLTLSPTTGLPTDKPYRPILVSISNDPSARPPLSLSEADIVYESVHWAPGHTRYLALYNDQHPEAVGPLRGIRTYHLEIRQGWDCPIVHRGGQNSPGTSIYQFMEEKGVPKGFSIDQIKRNQSVFFSQKDRISPHNYMVKLAKTLQECWPEQDSGEPYTPRLPGLRFSENPSQGDQPAAVVAVHYAGNNPDFVYKPSYTYNEKERLYERWYNGEEQYDGETGKRIVASNVIVRVMALRYYEDSPERPVMVTTGGGPIDAFIGGTRVRGRWARETIDDPFQYWDERGDPLVLLPGKTFVQIVPMALGLRYEEARGGTFAYGEAP